MVGEETDLSGETMVQDVLAVVDRIQEKYSKVALVLTPFTQFQTKIIRAIPFCTLVLTVESLYYRL